MPAPQLRKPPPRISATAAATIKVHELVEFQPCVADEFPQGTFANSRLNGTDSIAPLSVRRILWLPVA